MRLYTYIFKNTKTGEYKVGRSYNIASRLSVLQSNNPHKITLIKATRATSKSEKEVLKALKAYNIRGEWFKADKFVNGYIAALTDDYRADQTVISGFIK